MWPSWSLTDRLRVSPTARDRERPGTRDRSDLLLGRDAHVGDGNGIAKSTMYEALSSNLSAKGMSRAPVRPANPFVA